MALFILCGNDYSSFTRIYMLSLIILVFVCSFSYCSSFDSSNTEIGNNVDVINDNKNLNDENNKYHRLFYRPSSSSGNDYLNAHDNRILSKERLLNLLLQSALNQEEDRPHRRYPVHIDNRRYAPQSFHAMRG